jgi:predicted dehydrogenase
MNLAMIGCGYVAEFYSATLCNYPQLKLIGAFDHNPRNLNEFCRATEVRQYKDVRELLDDRSVELVLNLTNPRSHFEVTRQCLDAGKHVYSEKPLAMSIEDSRQLVALAAAKGMRLASAPGSFLNEQAQAIAKAVREGLIGRIRLVYANFDDGMIAPHQKPWNWRNNFGVPWPAKDEFEVGCTYEHAGYLLTWLAAFFGPAKTVTAFASCQIRNKGIPVDTMAPDFTVGCIEYGREVVARVTCSLVAPKDRSLTIIGDDGVIKVESVRDELCPVYLQRLSSGRRTILWHGCVNGWRKFFRWRPARSNSIYLNSNCFSNRRHRLADDAKPVDFCRGPAELANAIREDRPCRLSPELGLHIVELTEALQYPERFGGRKVIESSIAPIEPMPIVMERCRSSRS